MSPIVAVLHLEQSRDYVARTTGADSHVRRASNRTWLACRRRLSDARLKPILHTANSSNAPFRRMPAASPFCQRDEGYHQLRAEASSPRALRMTVITMAATIARYPIPRNAVKFSSFLARRFPVSAVMAALTLVVNLVSESIPSPNLNSTTTVFLALPAFSNSPKIPRIMGKFKAPALRNVAVTAPYMHDGSLATLEDVLSHYAAGGGHNNPNQDPLIAGFTLSSQDQSISSSFSSR